ncbi:hypothetical protein [Paraflavitalea sp. CAU 1676]|uniref:hypothetical protein n=1 Tax=Paraflavitalea sp. CAU 1676 TaxID=3032598 RepID=UPI0023DB16AE|nr:hypothetical protein [Paraflavitalea sp. CAU 1676]MDF2192589.1 hypothetical protein [Paraflavitalea sp. CAU 1676]
MKSNTVETKQQDVEVLLGSEQALREKIDLLSAIIGGKDIETCNVGTFSESTFHQIKPPIEP